MDSLFKQKENERDAKGYSLVELLIATLLAAVVMAAIYQTVRLYWQNLHRTTREAKLLANVKRTLGRVEKELRNSGYNPLAIPYDTENDLTRRIGIVAAWPDRIVLSSDLISATGSPDGLILTASTLDRQLSPVAGRTDGREISSFRLYNGQLQQYVAAPEQQGRWQILTKGVRRLLFTYFDANGEPIATDRLYNDPKTLKDIHRLDIFLELEERAAVKPIKASTKVSVLLRNLPVLTPTQTP